MKNTQSNILSNVKISPDRPIINKNNNNNNNNNNNSNRNSNSNSHEKFNRSN